MSPNLYLAIGLGCLAIGVARANVTNVTVNGSISGSGSLAVECGFNPVNPPSACVDVFEGFFVETLPISFSGTNTMLGEFDAGANVEGDFLGAYLVASAQQNTSATANSLGISLYGSVSYLGNQGQANATDTVDVSFDLSTASSVQLSGFDELVATSDTSELLDSHGNLILAVPSGNGSVATVLQPGAYQLEASASGGFFGGTGSEDADLLSLTLNADFTPVQTPEPRGAFLAVFLTLAAWVSWKARARMTDSNEEIASVDSDACRHRRRP